MLQRRLFNLLEILLLTLSLLSSAIIGCDDESPSTCSGESPGPCYRIPWASPTDPESLITNLQLSYRNRDIERYVDLLAPEYRFKFQPIDANEIGTDSWTRDQDSTGTRALLTTTEVSDIRIGLTYGSRDSSVDLSPPVDSLKIRIVRTDLQVDQTDGTTWVVTLTDPQDFFFRQGQVNRGENPSHWFIYEWDDLPTLASPGLSGPGRITWGSLKTMYRN